MGAADGVGTGFGEPEVGDLAGGDEVLDGAGDVLDRDGRVDTVLVEQVDALDAESLQRAVDGLADVVRPAVEAATFSGLWVEAPPELGGDDDLVADRTECFTDECLVGERAVDLGGVEERDAEVDGGADQADHRVRVVDGSVVGAHAHAAETERGDLQSSTSERSSLHGAVFFHQCAGRVHRAVPDQLLPDWAQRSLG